MIPYKDIYSKADQRKHQNQQTGSDRSGYKHVLHSYLCLCHGLTY